MAELAKKRKKTNGILQKIKRRGDLLPFCIPAMAFAIIFCYLPMFGLIMAFKDEPNLFKYDAFDAILKASFNNFENFKKIFSDSEFTNALKNTLIISTLKIVIVFPLPIALAIIITEVKSKGIPKALEITMYLPHFLSWIIVDAMFTAIFSQSTGLVNNIFEFLGFDRIKFFTDPKTFRGTTVFLSAWKDIGWSTITYIAAITTIDPALSEAARIEGATKMQRIRYVIIPGISSTIAVLFIMRIGYVMDAGFEQIYPVYTTFVQETGDILGTYSYRLVRGSTFPKYALSTAIGLFNSTIAMILVLLGNFISRKLFHRGIW